MEVGKDAGVGINGIKAQESQQVSHSRNRQKITLLRGPDFLGELLQRCTESHIAFSQSLDCPIGMQDSAMVSAAKVAADFRQAVAGQASRKVHAHLSRQADRPAAFSALKVGQAHAVTLCNGGDDLFDGNFAPAAVGAGAERLLS